MMDQEIPRERWRRMTADEAAECLGAALAALHKISEWNNADGAIFGTQAEFARIIFNYIVSGEFTEKARESEARE